MDYSTRKFFFSTENRIFKKEARALFISSINNGNVWLNHKGNVIQKEDAETVFDNLIIEFEEYCNIFFYAINLLNIKNILNVYNVINFLYYTTTTIDTPRANLTYTEWLKFDIKTIYEIQKYVENQRRILNNIK